MDVLMCEPVEGQSGRYIVPDSIESTCQDCGTRVHIAPSSQKVMDQMIVVCLTCGLARLQSNPSPELGTIEGVAEEIRTYRKRN